MLSVVQTPRDSLNILASETTIIDWLLLERHAPRRIISLLTTLSHDPAQLPTDISIS